MSRVRRHAWRVLPLLLLLGFYWPGLTNWFYQDDFGWLNLRREVHSVAGLGPALFAPKAHGNLRPLGENAYFLVFSSLFGVDALPFRIWAFATGMASLLLLGSIVQRLTASRAAAVAAQILWIANPGLAAAMCWTSIYNQILSGFFFLLAFYFLLRQIETGATRYYLAQWAAFVLGMGALETNIMYPALAAVYAFLFARPYLRKILPMFPVSALVVWLHLHFAPPPREGVYAMHLDSRIFSTLWAYSTRALGPPPAAAALLSLAAAAFILWQARRRQWTGLFCVAWFLITVSPYLPLPDHQMDYYLAVPVIGVAMLGAWALASAWRARPVWRVTSLLCAAVYLATALPSAWAITRWHHARGLRVEDLVLGVAEIHQAQPGKIILLDGIDSDLFWSGIVDVPFRVMSIPHVYLAPGAEGRIQGSPALVTRYVLPPALALRAVVDERAVVYLEEGGVLRNVTGRYRALAPAIWKAETPRFINLGDTVYEEYLGPGWNAAADGYRVLSRTGALHIGAPRGPDDHLYVTIFRGGEYPIGLRVNGMNVTPELIRRDRGYAEFRAGLPAALIGRDAIEVQVSNGGAAPLRFGFVEVRP